MYIARSIVVKLWDRAMAPLAAGLGLSAALLAIITELLSVVREI